MRKKWFGLSIWGWGGFAVHVIVFNLLQGHENMFRFLAGLIGSYIEMRIIFFFVESILDRNKPMPEEEISTEI